MALVIPSKYLSVMNLSNCSFKVYCCHCLYSSLLKVDSIETLVANPNTDEFTTFHIQLP